MEKKTYIKVPFLSHGEAEWHDWVQNGHTEPPILWMECRLVAVLNIPPK